MMKIRKTWLAAITAGVLCAAAMTTQYIHTQAADTLQTSDGLTYQIQSDDTAVITGCYATATEVTIPDNIDSISVTSIGASAFSGCTQLTTVSIPDSVTEIGASAFSDCALTAVQLPESVAAIDSGAFSSDSLQRISITNASCVIADNAIGENAIIYCWSDSTALSYAAENQLPWMEYQKLSSKTPSYGLGSIQITYNQLSARENTLTFEIWAQNDAPFSVLAFGMQLPSCMTYLSADTTTSAIFIPSQNNGFIWYPLINAEEIDTTIIGSITVSVSVSSNGTYTIAMANENLIGSPATADGVVPRLTDGTLTVSDVIVTTAKAKTTTTTTTTTTAAATAATSGSNTTQAETESFLRGDVDSNGEVDIFDAYQALLAYARISAGMSSALTSVQEKAADVDDDGTISIYDAHRILLYYAEKSAGMTPSWS